MAPSTVDVHPPVDELDAESCSSSASSITFSLLSSSTKSLSAGGTPNWNSNRSLNRCRWQGEETEMIGLPPLSGADPLEEIQELLMSSAQPKVPTDSSPKMPAWKLREQTKRNGLRDVKPMVPQRSWRGPIPDLADEDIQDTVPSLFQPAVKNNRQSPKLPVRTTDSPGALNNVSDHAVAPTMERSKMSRWDASNETSSCSSSSSDTVDSQNHNAPLPTRSGTIAGDPETRKRKKKIKTPKAPTNKSTKGLPYEESTSYTEVPLKGEAKSSSPKTRTKNAVAKAIAKASQDSSTSQIPSLFQIPKEFQKKPQSTTYLKRRNLKKHKSDLRRRRRLVDDSLASILEEDCENLSPMRDVDHRVMLPRSCPNIMVSRLDDRDLNEPTDDSRTSGDASRHTAPDELADWEGRKSQWSGMGSRKLNIKA